MSSDSRGQGYNTQDDYDDEIQKAPLTYDALREQNRRSRLQYQPESGPWSNPQPGYQAPTIQSIGPSDPFDSQPATEVMKKTAFDPTAGFTPEDMRLLRQCNKEGFYKRCKILLSYYFS